MSNFNRQPVQQTNNKTINIELIDEAGNHLMWSNLPKYPTGKNSMDQNNHDYMEDQLKTVDGKHCFTTEDGIKVYIKISVPIEPTTGQVDLRATYAK